MSTIETVANQQQSDRLLWSKLLIGLVVCCSVVVLFAARFGLPLPLQNIANVGTMPLSTALGFALCGTAVLLPQRHKPAALVLAGTASILAIGSLFLYATGAGKGLETKFWTNVVGIVPSWAGQMSLWESWALLLLCVGTFVTIISKPSPVLLWLIIAGPVVSVVMSAVLWMEVWYRKATWAGSAFVAVYSPSLFVGTVFSFALALISWNRLKDKRASIIDAYLAWFIAVVVGLMSFLWQNEAIVARQELLETTIAAQNEFVDAFRVEALQHGAIVPGQSRLT